MTALGAGLRGLLAAYEPATDAERRHSESIEGMLDGHRAFDREAYDPGHITASGFVVHPSRPAVVLVEHRKLGRWLQPGGHVEPSDPDIESAARREVAEETGLRDLRSLGIVDLDVHPFPARGGRPRHLHFDVRLGFVSETDGLTHGHESTGIAWFGLPELGEMDESLARAARRLEAMNRAGTLRPD